MNRIKSIARSFLPGSKPDFLILGAQKAGTTSLHTYLKGHPLLVGSKPKEIDFFSNDDNFSKGQNWYCSHFKSLSGVYNKIHYYESSPNYLYRSKVPKRIAQFRSDLKFIILLREPISRAYSSWNMYKELFKSNRNVSEGKLSGYLNGVENSSLRELFSLKEFPTFEECVQMEFKKIKLGSLDEEPSFLRMGFYWEQIERYFTYFPRTQFLFLGSKDLALMKVETLNKILEFLNVPAFNWEVELLMNKHQREYSETISPTIKSRLQDLYEPHNVRLFNNIGIINW